MTNGLNSAEWDFGNILDSEVIACYSYEFARESPALKIMVKEHRGDIGPVSFESVLELNRRYGSFNFDALRSYRFFLWYPEWPQKPYLHIQEKTRRDRIEILTRTLSDPELAARLRPIGRPIYLPEKLSAEPTNAQPSTIQIAIHPWLTHDELRKAFAALLKRDFPDQGKASGNHLRPQGRAGGLAPRKQALRALGIYRLLHTQTAGEALKFLEKMNHPLRLSDESALNRSRRPAEKAIKKFETDALD